MHVRTTRRWISGTVLLACVAGCAPVGPNDLDKLGTARASISGEPFELWVADEPLEIQRGLMFVTAEQMAPLPDGTRRGMLFMFPTAQRQSATMRNVSIPLDIAYLDEEGVVVTMFTMQPFDDRPGAYDSGVAVRSAVEVNAGVLSELGVEVGDVMLKGMADGE